MLVGVDCNYNDEYDEFVLMWNSSKFTTKHGLEYDHVDMDDYWVEEE